MSHNHRLQRSGEADVFEVVHQLSPPAEPGRYPTKMTAKNYMPVTLPAIDSVEVVDIRRIEANRVTQYMDLASEAPCVRLCGDDAQAIASAFRSLTPGDAARCHVPPIGLRFFATGRCLTSVSVCWQCNNLFGTQDGWDVSFAFDSDGVAAQSLLNLARVAIGEDVVENG